MERILTVRACSEILRSMVLAWDPDWGVAASDDQALLSPKTGDVLVSWLIYFSRRRGTIPPLPEPVRVEPVEDKGTLVVLAPERPTVSNPEHLELSNQVRLLLDEAGLLRRPKS